MNHEWKKRLIQASLPIVSILGGACLLTDVASADDSVVFLETGVLVATETTIPVASGTTTPIASDTTIPVALDTTTPVATDTTVVEGWETTDDGNRKYHFSDDTYTTGEVQIDNVWYTFDEDDYQKYGWQYVADGWQTIDDNKYYFDTSGIMQTGWQTIDRKNYYFNKSTGVCQNDAEDTLYKKAVEIYQENMFTYYKEVLTEVNKIRKAAGLSSLTLDEDLCIAATMRALEMDENNILSHVRPTSYYNTEGETNYSGDNWYTVLYYMNISYSAAGENCASGLSTAASVVAAWESSSGHYANMVNTSYTKIGVGFSADGKVWVQLFT